MAGLKGNGKDCDLLTYAYSSLKKACHINETQMEPGAIWISLRGQRDRENIGALKEGQVERDWE